MSLPARNICCGFREVNQGAFRTFTSAAPGNEEDVPVRSTNLISGGRFTLGYWMIEDNPWVPEGIRTCGVEARFFFVGSGSANASIMTRLRPCIARFLI